jgi:hypothetical protein
MLQVEGFIVIICGSLTFNSSHQHVIMTASWFKTRMTLYCEMGQVTNFTHIIVVFTMFISS